MNILVVSATAAEITPFLDDHRNQLSAFNHEIDVLVSGIGLMSTTFSLTKQLQFKKPELVIQAGVGGCFDSNIPLGSVFVVKKDIVADLGVMEKGTLKTIADLGLAGKNRFPYSNEWLVNKNSLLTQVKLKKVSAVSINEITTSKQKINAYRERFEPVVESMEGAALHYVCLTENTPFIQLRSVSNYIGERNKKKWRMKEAIVNLNKELIHLLKTI